MRCPILRQLFPLTSFALFALFTALASAAIPERPNILLVISDDQSWLHTSAYGFRGIRTPGFDRVAKSGVLFRNAIGASPGCSPCRAALLTGRHTWMIEHAGTHASSFPRKYTVYPELLQKAGYHVGLTGKGWGPGNWQIDGWPHNPAGPAVDQRKAQAALSGVSANDYAANFADFLAQKPKDRPFCFWFGAGEPHRAFEKGAGLRLGKKLEDAVVPPFLPDTPEIRSDILDYLVEIEHYDSHLARILQRLDEVGELANTLVIVTADNGMAFPRAKANCYEYGVHMPLAIAWPARVPGARVVEDVVGFVDLTATILDAAQVERPASAPPGVGRSLMNILTSRQQGVVDATRTRAFSARERHSSSRPNNLGYPQRAMRTEQFLFIRNFAPDRWPAGDPRTLGANGKLGPAHGAYHDIDSSPSLTFLTQHHADPKISRFLELAVGKRPAEELYDIRQDPGCLVNLAADPKHGPTRQRLAKELEDYLRQTGDPRVLGKGEIWETYIRYSPLREFPKS